MTIDLTSDEIYFLVASISDHSYEILGNHLTYKLKPSETKLVNSIFDKFHNAFSHPTPTKP